MNILSKAKSKTIGYYLGLIASVIGIGLLILFCVYSSKNATSSVIVFLVLILAVLIEAAMFLLPEKIEDILAVFPPILYMLAACESLHTGVGNIIDSIQGIVMFGNADLALINYIMAGIGMFCMILSVISAFMKKEK